MKNTRQRARAARWMSQWMAHAACLGVLLCCSTSGAAMRLGGGQHTAPAPRAAAPRAQAAPQYRSPARPQGAPQQNGYPQANPNPQGYGAARPPYNGSPYSVRANPQGGVQGGNHLPQWMAQHQNLPLGQQEKLLRQEPGFNRLNPAQQQREIQQLHQLNQLPEPQRDRRLARAENFERLSPAEKMQVRESSRQLSTLPPDRQAVVRHAFRDLGGVPIDQRQTVLNSARYGAAFSPEERGILSNLLRLEPYEGPRY